MTWAPAGAIEFPGIAAPLNASFTLTPGVTPSVCQIRIAPQPAWSPRVGTLALSYGSTTIQFRDCIIDRVQATLDGSGHLVWDVSILDRRWKWKGLGKISGYYNVRREAAMDEPLEIVDGTEKSPRELARLCLDALGETTYNLDDMPDDPRPEIEWDYTTPAQALAQLCDDLDCVVVLTLRDKIRITRRGSGVALGMGTTFLSGGEEIDPPEQPDEIVIVTQPKTFQTDMELEAVGLDEDMQVKPIDELSYIPFFAGVAPTWRNADPEEMLCIEDPAHRKLAVQSVFRWYRPKVPIDLNGEKVGSLDRILPFLGHQVLNQWFIDETGKQRKEPRPAEIFGRFWAGAAGIQDAALKSESDLTEIGDGDRIYPGKFTLDEKTGLVKFSDAVYRLSEDGRSALDRDGIWPAVLKLRVAFNLRDKDTRGWVRHEYKRRLPGAKNGTKAAYFRHEDLAPKYWKTPATGWSDNLAEVDPQAGYYMRERLRTYQTQQPYSATYAGFERIEPDGLITSVTWWVSDEGYAMTRAMRGKEEVGDFASYAERRLWERQAEERRAAAKTKAEEARRQRRARA
jgi:hypothetical protein